MVLRINIDSLLIQSNNSGRYLQKKAHPVKGMGFFKILILEIYFLLVSFILAESPALTIEILSRNQYFLMALLT
jgi:hypothetical protein